MTRPLTAPQRAQAAENLRALADELDRSGAADVQALLGVALEVGYPTAGSGVPAQRANRTDENGQPLQPDTRPEALALQPDRVAAEAADLIRRTVRISVQARRAADQLAGWHAGRAVRFCPRCAHPYEADATRCRQVVDGVQCAAREETDRRCRGENCPRPDPVMRPGEHLRSGLCDVCRKRADRKRTRPPSERIARVERLYLDDNMIEADGA